MIRNSMNDDLPDCQLKYLIFPNAIMRVRKHIPQILLFIFLCLHITTAVSQITPLKQWDRKYGGIRSDDMYVIIQTIDGGYLLGGDSDSPAGGDKSEDCRGLSDYWIIKTDAYGNKQWDRRFGGNSSDEMYTVLQTADKGYLLGGWSVSNENGDQTQTSRGGRDYWIVKVDVNGNKLWDKRFGGPADDEMRAMAQTSDGGFILAGESRSGVGGEKTQVNNGAYDVWVVKTDLNGNLQWDACYGGSDDDRLNAVQQTTDGGYLFGAWTNSPLGFDVSEVGKGLTDMWLIKADASGQKMWDHRFGGSDNEYLYALDQTHDGGFILGGYTRSPVGGDVSEVGQGAYDFWLLKTDGMGTKLWDKRYGGLMDEKGKSIYETSDGGFMMGGWSQSNAGGDKSQDTKGITDYWVVRVDVEGRKFWDMDLGANLDERLHAVPQTADGGFIIGGHSNSGLNGDKSQSNEGLSDYWMVKLSAPIPTAVYFADADGDGFGNELKYTVAAASPPGFVSNHADCNDQSEAIHPGAIDLCNLIDDDCNGLTDEHAFEALMIPSGLVEVCKGDDVTLYAPSSGTVIFQWLKNGSIINNVTNDTYVTGKKGDYQLQEMNAFDCLSVSAVTSINTLSKPDAVITPLGNLDICEIGVVLLQANIGNNLTYVWKKDGNKIVGATSQNYMVTEAGGYKVIVTKNNGCKKTSSMVMVVKSCKQYQNALFNLNQYLSVYPNPSPGSVTVHLLVDELIISEKQDNLTGKLNIFNALGQVVYETAIEIRNGKLVEQVILKPGVPNGIYMVQVLIAGNEAFLSIHQWFSQFILQR